MAWSGTEGGGRPGRGALESTERATTVAMTAGTPLMASAPLVPVGGRGTGRGAWKVAGGVVSIASLAGGREGTLVTLTGGSLVRGSTTGAELSWVKMVSVSMAGGRAGAEWPVVTVHARATAGGSLLARGSRPGAVVMKPSSPAGKRGGPTLMPGICRGSAELVPDRAERFWVGERGREGSVVEGGGAAAGGAVVELSRGEVLCVLVKLFSRESRPAWRGMRMRHRHSRLQCSIGESVFLMWL